MAFNMNGSPLNKLNLFRKGRGKDYRQTKRAIKKAVGETGGFSATENEAGGWNIQGATGGGTGKIHKGGQSKRRLARSAAEAMTSGIDKETFLSDADKGSRFVSGSIVGSKDKKITKKSRVSQGEGQGDIVTGRKKEVTTSKGYGWAGGGTKEGTWHDEPGTVKITGTDADDVRKKRADFVQGLESNVRVKGGFKMKYSPFNQGFGSPLNWNERSPLNNLKDKDGELVPSTKGVYMKEGSSPLNQTEAECTAEGKVWRKGNDGKMKCFTKKSETTTETVTDDDITVREKQTGLENTETGTTEERKELKVNTKGMTECEKKHGKISFGSCCDGEKQIKKDGGCQCHACIQQGSEKDIKNKTANCVKQHGAGYKWDGKECVLDGTETTTETANLNEKEAETELALQKKKCDEKGGTWKGGKDGNCVGEAGDQDIEGTTKVRGGKQKCVKPRGGCGDKRWDKEACKCVDKTCNKTASDCNENQMFDADKCRCVRDKDKIEKGKQEKQENKKNKKDNKDCKCLEWDCE